MKYTDGKTIKVVAPTGGFAANRGYRVDGWNGVAEQPAAAGEDGVLNIDPVATFYIKIPAGVSANVGDVLYMPPAGGDAETDATATASGNVAAFKVHEAKDANNIVGVRVLNVA